MASLLHQMPAAKKQYLIRILNGGKPVGYKYEQLILLCPADALKQLIFRNRVKGAGGFVKHHNRGVLYERSCCNDFLGLPAGQHGAVLRKFLCQHCIQPTGKRFYCIVGSGQLKRLPNPFLRNFFPHADVVSHRSRQDFPILKRGGKQAAVGTQVVFPDIPAIDQYPALRRVIQA